eukprot:scaffold187001_cov62-Attheya_sp.AAC.3
MLLGNSIKNERYTKKMITQQSLKDNPKRGNKNVALVTNKRKQHNRRKLIRDYINSSGHKKDGQYLDTLTFGWDSTDDGTVCSLGGLTSMTPTV